MLKNLKKISTSQPKPTEIEESPKGVPKKEYINWNEEWKYALYSKIHDDCAILYHSNADEKKKYCHCCKCRPWYS